MSIGTIKILDFLELRKTYLLVPKLYKQLFHLIQHGQVNPVILSESWQLYSNSLIISFSVFIYNVFPVTLTKAFVKQWPRLCIGFVRQLWAAEFQLQRGKCKLPNTLNCIFDKKKEKSLNLFQMNACFPFLWLLLELMLLSWEEKIAWEWLQKKEEWYPFFCFLWLIVQISPSWQLVFYYNSKSWGFGLTRCWN